MAARAARAACWAAAVLCQLWGAAGKLEAGVVLLGDLEAISSGASSGAPSPWHFAGKFGYAIGTGTYEVRVRLREPADTTSVDFDVYLDEDWDQVASLQPCRRAARARRAHPVRASEAWSPWTGGMLMQNMRPHIWYFAISKCGGLSQPNATLELEYELKLLQFDDSELSVEMRHMPAATLLAVLCLSWFLLRFALQCRTFRRATGCVHPVIRTLAAAASLQWAAQVLHLVHLLAYERNGGVGFASAEAFADILFMLSQVVSSTLLIVIAQGYTLDRSKDLMLDSVKPIAAVVALLHVLLVGQGKMQGEHSDKHHENEGVVGWTLILMRMLLYVWFVVGVQVLRQSSGFRLQPFLSRFLFAGSLYFLSYPVIYGAAQLFAEYLQHPIMQIGMVAMQTGSAFWLSKLFLTRGAYYEVSTLSASLLPGGCSPSGSPSGLKRD